MEKVKAFLRVDSDSLGDGSGFGLGSGYGSGYGLGDGSGLGSGLGYDLGYGSGDGYGDGSGDGSGDGLGDGSGDGYGSGDGSGFGFGLKSINNQKIYLIDGIQTIISNVNRNIAKGFIVNNDLTLKPCFIAKGENKFAHAETIKKAVDSLNAKLLIDLPIEKRILKFIGKFGEPQKKYKAVDFYEWHYFLTASCDMGRKSFVSNHNIDLKKDKFTVFQFIELVKNDYGSHIINQLKKSYGKQT